MVEDWKMDWRCSVLFCFVGFGETDEGAGVDPYETGAHDLGGRGLVLMGRRGPGLPGSPGQAVHPAAQHTTAVSSALGVLLCSWPSLPAMGPLPQARVLGQQVAAAFSSTFPSPHTACSDGGCGHPQLQLDDVSAPFLPPPTLSCAAFILPPILEARSTVLAAVRHCELHR